MQVVIKLPRFEDAEILDTPVCRVPLLVREILTAIRAGASRVLLLCPPGVLDRLPRIDADTPVEVAAVAVPFDPGQPANWRGIQELLEERFLWMPCGYVAHKAAMVELIAAAEDPPDSSIQFRLSAGSAGGLFNQPAVFSKSDLIEGHIRTFEIASSVGPPGVSLRPPATVRDAEIELVRRSGKVTDGFYSNLNRKLCRPAVRWLCHTSVTPNAVSFAGLAVAVLSAVCFAQGAWAFDVAGGMLFFISGLFDEIDGMLARLTFKESAFGCWLETCIDYTTYLLLFAGMTVGGYRRGGEAYVLLGAILILGCVLSFAAISWQRKLAAPADKPSDYYRRHLSTLDRDTRNPISVAIRNLQFLTRKGVLMHYVLLFAILGLTPLVLILSSVGANIAWMVTLYFNRRFYLPRRPAQRLAAVGHAVPTEVTK